MSVETVSQVLAPSGAPAINGVRARSKLAEALLKDVYQGLVETNGRGITDRFSTETDVSENAQIFVNRVKPAIIDPREMGASKNGRSFAADSHFVQTVTVGIDILTVVDDPIIIPRARQDLINVDLLATQVDLYVKRLNTIINGMTAAAKIYATWYADLKGNAYNWKNISATDVANKDLLVRFMECNDLLDQGDADNGIDVFPEETRVAVFKAGSRALLKAAGILALGGANYAYDIAKGGAVSEGDEKSVREDGYIGMIDNVPCHVISGESLGHASQFLGLGKTELASSTFFGYVSSSYANARGVSTVDQIKIVDTIDGQGIALQPFTKMGAISWYPKGNVIVTKEESGTSFLFSKLATLFSGIGAGTISLKLKGSGSRLWPAAGTVTLTTSTGFTATFTALDDANVDHIAAGYYYIGTAAASVADFIAKAAAATYKGAANVNGTATTETHLAANDVLNILAISDDGSLTIYSKKNA